MGPKSSEIIILKISYNHKSHLIRTTGYLIRFTNYQNKNVPQTSCKSEGEIRLAGMLPYTLSACSCSMMSWQLSSAAVHLEDCDRRQGDGVTSSSSKEREANQENTILN